MRKREVSGFMKKAGAKSRIGKAVKEAEVKLDYNKGEDEIKPEEDDKAVETLEQIADEWFQQQRSRFEIARRAARESDRPGPTKASDSDYLKQMRDTLCRKRRFEDVLYGSCFCAHKIWRFIKRQIRRMLVRLVEYILKVEKA
jgi:hypothetical protein